MLKSRIAAIAVTGAGLMLASTASAAVQVTSYDSPFVIGSRYGAFSGVGTITQEATGVRAQATGFGGFFHDLPALSVNGTGMTAIKFDFTVVSGDAPPIVAVLGDTDFTEIGFRFFSSGPGTYSVTLPLGPVGTEVPNVGNVFLGGPGAIEGLNLEDIDYIHTQIDAHGSAVPYNVSFDNVSLVAVPEPTSLAVLAVAGAVIGRRRR
jgi:hypothetical protein